jgi:molybdopterin converting factor small subunit
MITVHVRLFGILRDRLPEETKGRITLSLPEGAAISAVLDRLDVHRHIQVAVNEEIEDNLGKRLHDGDKIEIFRPSAGGCKP